MIVANLPIPLKIAFGAAFVCYFAYPSTGRRLPMAQIYAYCALFVSHVFSSYVRALEHILSDRFPGSLHAAIPYNG